MLRKDTEEANQLLKELLGTIRMTPNEKGPVRWYCLDGDGALSLSIPANSGAVENSSCGGRI